MAQRVNNLPAIQETQERWVWFLGWKDPLEGEILRNTHSSILAWESLWTEESGRLLRPWDSRSKNTESVAISSSRNLPDPRIKPESPAVACIGRQILDL